jgi:hypothetical protein
MISFLCNVQEGCIPTVIRQDLEKGILTACYEVLGEDQGPVDFLWIEIPKGFGFRGGYPSTTSQVAGTIPDGCPQDKRELLMRKICNSWSSISKTTEDEAVIAIRDASWTAKNNT